MTKVYYKIGNRQGSVTVPDVPDGATISDLKLAFFGGNLTPIDATRVRVSLGDVEILDDDFRIPLTSLENRLLFIDDRGKPKVVTLTPLQ